MRIAIKPSARQHGIHDAEIRTVISYYALAVPIAARRGDARPMFYTGPAAANQPWIEVICRGKGVPSMSTHRLTNEEYAEMAADYAAHPPRSEEIVGPIEVNPVYLRKGRPAKDLPRATTGRTPALPVRLPEPIRSEMKNRVEAGETSSESELVRQALIEYFDNHPIGSRS